MDLGAMRASPIGGLVPIQGTDQRTGEHYDYWASLVEPLPVTVSLASVTQTAVARAEAALVRLDQAALQIPDPALPRQPSLCRQALSTSALEGTYAPIEAVLESELETRGQASREIHEVLNYVVAAEQAFVWVAERPITSNLLGNLQPVLVSGTAGDHSDAGGVRDRQVLIGPVGSRAPDARFVPPPPAINFTPHSKTGSAGSSIRPRASRRLSALASRTSSRPFIRL